MFHVEQMDCFACSLRSGQALLAMTMVVGLAMCAVATVIARSVVTKQSGLFGDGGCFVCSLRFARDRPPRNDDGGEVAGRHCEGLRGGTTKQDEAIWVVW